MDRRPHFDGKNLTDDFIYDDIAGGNYTEVGRFDPSKRTGKNRIAFFREGLLWEAVWYDLWNFVTFYYRDRTEMDSLMKEAYHEAVEYFEDICTSVNELDECDINAVFDRRDEALACWVTFNWRDTSQS